MTQIADTQVPGKPSVELVEFQGLLMHSDWPAQLMASQEVTHWEMDGKAFKRFRFGEEPYWGEPDLPFNHAYCPDCGCRPGQQHGFSCDMELCPRCLWQLLSCECDDDEEQQ